MAAIATAIAGCSAETSTPAGGTSSDGGSSGDLATGSSSLDGTTGTASTDTTSPVASTTTGVADSTETTGSTTAAGGESSTTGDARPGADALFDPMGIARIDLTLDDEAIDSLWDAPSAYAQADATIELTNGEVVVAPAIGVRLKGVYGSFRTLDQKAAFLLRFDELDPTQEPFGLEKLALNNMVQDWSMIHEQLAYALYREAGVPAPRTSYARVFVNGDLFGLYSMVEVFDDEQFLDTHFAFTDGNLYEGEYGSDLYPGWGPSFDQDHGTPVNFADLEELAAALDTMNDPQTLLVDLDGVIDAGDYLKFAATEIFIGHWDGYAWTRNNYFLYRGEDQRWTFMPWGQDQTFGEYLPIWGGGGRIQQMCGGALPCRQQLESAYTDVAQRVVDLDLVARCDELYALIEDAVAEDPRKEVSADVVPFAVEWTKSFLQQRPAEVAAQFACTDPTAIDEDDDGWPGCGIDCNDDDAAVYPGAQEVCDVDDDNCNGLLDDDPLCPQCVTVPADSGGTLAYCFGPRTYLEAEADCVGRGGHLASIHDQNEQDEIVAGAYGVMGGLWWIGFDDRTDEGEFVWTDGTPADFEAWADGEPNDYDFAEDCGHLADWAGGAWNDIGCDNWLPYVCRLP